MASFKLTYWNQVGGWVFYSFMEFYVIRLKKIRLKESRSTHQYSTMFFWLICTTLYTGYLDLLQNQLFLKCQLLHLRTLQVSFSRVLWKLKFLLSPSRSLQRKSYNCNTLLRKRDWITTKQNSLSHLFKPYQTWMKSHTSTHCGPIFQFSWITCELVLFLATPQ